MASLTNVEVVVTVSTARTVHAHRHDNLVSDFGLTGPTGSFGP